MLGGFQAPKQSFRETFLGGASAAAANAAATGISGRGVKVLRAAADFASA